MAPKKYYRRGSRTKYSVETSAGAIIVANYDGASKIVPESTVQGMRKVKHVTVSLATPAGGGHLVFWALVYVPAGTQPHAVSVGGGPIYEPNQYVMGSGVVDFNAGPCRFHCPLSRNLNSGDCIWLVVRSGEESAQVYYTVQYAIALN